MPPVSRTEVQVPAPARRPWQREELIAAFRLYCLLPFGRLHQRNPEIVALAEVLERSPSSVAMKLVNLASLDPAVTGTGRKGLGNASEGDRRIWREFHDDWAGLENESREILHRLGCPDPALPSSADQSPPAGETSVEALVRVRRGQDFFRRAVLASYGGRCCISGLAEPGLLLASHIMPWAKDPENRLNPSNGLCLSALHDRAFDIGFIAVGTDYRVRVSPMMRDPGENDLARVWLLDLEGTQILLPERFLPDRAFLAWHLENVFQAS